MRASVILNHNIKGFDTIYRYIQYADPIINQIFPSNDLRIDSYVHNIYYWAV